MASANQALEADANITNGENEDDFVSDTTSIESWIQEYRIENGRRYHSFGDKDYWGPNDEMAQQQLNLAHELFTKTFGGQLCLAPIPTRPIRVLDVGTGTGIWAIDFAVQYPEADIVGVDLSPIQPEWVPSNCRFEMDDIEREWIFPENHFDYIHVRTLVGGIAHWPSFYENCYRHLKAGGILEQAEYAAGMYSEDGSLKPDSAIATSGDFAKACFEKLGRSEGDLDIYATMQGRISQAGFQNVTLHKFRWPLGTWPKDKKMKELGRWASVHLDMGLEGYLMRLMTTLLGSTPEEVTQLCDDVRAQLKDRRTHAIWPMNVVIATKPVT